MVQKSISGEQPFQVLAHSVGIGPSEGAYTLQYSADGVNYTDYEEEIPANETLIINGFNKGCFFRLKGNSSTVVVNY